jgi:hypothetical protein
MIGWHPAQKQMLHCFNRKSQQLRKNKLNSWLSSEFAEIEFILFCDSEAYIKQVLCLCLIFCNALKP